MSDICTGELKKKIKGQKRLLSFWKSADKDYFLFMKICSKMLVAFYGNHLKKVPLFLLKFAQKGYFLSMKICSKKLLFHGNLLKKIGFFLWKSAQLLDVFLLSKMS